MLTLIPVHKKGAVKKTSVNLGVHSYVNKQDFVAINVQLRRARMPE